MSFYLESPRLIIRNYLPHEENTYVAMHLNPAVNRFLPPRTAEQYRTVFREGLMAADQALNRWAMIYKEDEGFAGSCLLRNFNAEPDGFIELGYSMAENYWGKGLATEMAGTLVTYALSLPQLKKLVAVTDPENMASQKVLQKAGFVNKGSIDKHGARGLTYFEYEG